MRLRAERSLLERTQEAILELLREGNLKSGDQLPTEVVLAEMLKVGRSTLREAIGNLVAGGILNRVQGRGTFVVRPPVLLNQGLDKLQSVTEIIRATGATPSTSRLTVERISVSDEISGRLGLEVGQPCIRIERVRRADDAVAVFSIDVLSHEFDAHLAMGMQASLFEMLEAAGRPVAFTQTSISPATLTQEELPELIRPTLFLLLEETYFDREGAPVCYGNDYYNAEIVRFDLVRSR